VRSGPLARADASLEHPAALLFPELDALEFDSLVANMRESGFDEHHPIWLYEGRIRANPVVAPDGRHPVIVGDPPWKYESRSDDPTHRSRNPFPDMTVEQICALPIASLAKDDSILWLWVTNAFLIDGSATRVPHAWDFTPKSLLTFMGNGDWLRGQTEHCILAVRGKPRIDPDYACPGSKLEMFSRIRRDGWTPWGAEIDRFPIATVTATGASRPSPT